MPLINRYQIVPVDTLWAGTSRNLQRANGFSGVTDIVQVRTLRKATVRCRMANNKIFAKLVIISIQGIGYATKTKMQFAQITIISYGESGVPVYTVYITL